VISADRALTVEGGTSMRTTTWTRRLVVTGCAAGIGLGVVGVGSAAAQGDPSPTPAPITISSAQVAQLCEQRVPKLQGEVGKLIDRIDGGADVVGSTRWLTAQEQKADANGRADRVKLLDSRIQRRTGVLSTLQGARTKLADFTSAHCGYLGDGK
jgi:hypothetical protein